MDLHSRIKDALDTKCICPEVCAKYVRAVQTGRHDKAVELLRELFLQDGLQKFEHGLSQGESFEVLTEDDLDIAELLDLRSVCVCQKCHGKHDTDGECGDDCYDCCSSDERGECTKCMVCLESGDPAEWRCSCEHTYLWRTHCLMQKAGMPGRSNHNPLVAYDPTDPDDEMMCVPEACA